MNSTQPLDVTPEKKLSQNITRVLSLYGFITDSYIIEFFTNNLWENLPKSWRSALSDLPSPKLADQLLSNSDTNHVSYRSVWPLSLMALKAAAHSLAFPRTPLHEDSNVNRPEEFLANHCQSSMLDPLFRKHVKPKKQHEIRQLGKLVKKLSSITDCDQVVDIGSGQGHLSRFLSFGQGLSVTAVEADKNLVTMAGKFDQHLMYMLQKENGRAVKNNNSIGILPKPPQHVVAWVDPKESWEDLLSKLNCTIVEKDSAEPLVAQDFIFSANTPHTEMKDPKGQHETPEDFTKRENGTSTSNLYGQEQIGHAMLGTGPNPKTQFGTFNLENCSCHVVNTGRHCRFVLTGLHACGDLSVAMLRHFARCPSIVGITSVACCYMKISTCEMPQPPGVLSPTHPGDFTQTTEYGYPMSSWVAQLPGHKLSYKAREVACHAIEDYTERLKEESSILRTHCYRAVLETIIRRIDPTMIRPGVQTIKKAHELPFIEYARLGLKRVGLDPDTSIDEEKVQSMLSQHQNVVAFFSLALLLAPLVETLILVDRMIYLQEQGFRCHLIPLFKPKFSPRNLVLVAAKRDISSTDLLADLKVGDVNTAWSRQ
ncbi:methyltransferase-like protein 25B [Discoglossus pictus]